MAKFLISYAVIISAFGFNNFYDDSDKIRCFGDSDCPQIQCIRAPCPNYICEDYRCSLILHEPSDSCRILNETYCLPANITIPSTDIILNERQPYCFTRFGICNLIDEECAWERSKDIKFCLFALS